MRAGLAGPLRGLVDRLRVAAFFEKGNKNDDAIGLFKDGFPFGVPRLLGGAVELETDFVKFEVCLSNSGVSEEGESGETEAERGRCRTREKTAGGNHLAPPAFELVDRAVRLAFEHFLPFLCALPFLHFLVGWALLFFLT